MKKKILLSTEEMLSGTPPKKKTLSTIVVEVLISLEPQEKVEEPEPGDGRKGSNNVPIDDVEEDRDQESNQWNNLIEGTLVLNVEEEVQMITSHPKFQAKSPTFETHFRLIRLSKIL